MTVAACSQQGSQVYVSWVERVRTLMTSGQQMGLLVCLRSEPTQV